MKALFAPSVFLILGGMAAAESAPDFDRLDLNRDGVLLPEEVQDALSVDFNDADTDGDGALSRTEFAAAAKFVPGGDKDAS